MQLALASIQPHVPRRLQTVQERFNEHITKAYDENVASLMTRAWRQCDDLRGSLICLTISAR